jgi:putative endonuclease
MTAGQRAEQAAADYLEHQGYKILARNWRTPACEIDIIAERKHTAHCFEVKYREHAAQGTGLAYITPKKLKKMSFGAELWVQTENWQDDYCIGGIEVSGPHFEITEIIESIAD